MKYGVNSGLIMLKKEDGIIINSTNNYFKEIVKTSDNNFTWKLLNFLKKPQDFNSIKQYFNLTHSDTLKILNTLLNKKLIIENPLTEKNGFFRVDRFINSLPNITFTEYTQKIKSINIMILGIGTAGSYTLEFLSKLGFKNFIIIDNDVVEAKNIVSQNYRYNDIGSLKTKVLKKKYSNCNIIPISKKIRSYTELKQLLQIYNPQYLLSNADDSKLVIDILNNVFKDYPSLKILESGYNVAEVQFELINKYNYKFFKREFIKMQNYFMKNGNFNGIADNSGIIFHSFISAFFSSKFIFDDITGLSTSDWGRFNLIENKYFLDNRFYWSDFQKYVYRYRKDHELSLSNNSIPTKKDWNDKIKLFLIKKFDDTAFKFLKNLNIHRIDKPQSLTIDKLKKLLIQYSTSTFNSKLISTKDVINNNIVLFADNFNSTHNNYSERANGLENRIYIGAKGEDKIVNYIHETFHTLLFNISNDSYIHENFVLENMLHFCIFLKNKNNRYFEYISKLIITYIQGYYLDDFLLVNKEKFEVLNQSYKFYEKLDYTSMKVKSKNEFNKAIENKTKNKPKFYFIRYTYPVENNLNLIKEIVSDLNME